MARLSLTTQQISRTGLNPALAGPPNVDGDVMDAGATFLQVHNGSGGSINVTIAATVVVDGLALANLVVAVPAGQDRLIGPFPVRTFAQEDESPDAGRVYVNYSAQASVTRGAFKLQ
jgi:hypothetical protein